MKKVVVLFPSGGMGHLIPTVELAKLFTAHAHDLSVTIVLIETPFSPSSTVDPFTAAVTAANPSISFHRLPPLSPPPTSTYLDMLSLANPHISSLLISLSQTSTVCALILDMFCTATLDVAADLRVPSFVFFSSSASNLAAFLFISTLQSKLNPASSFKDLGDALLDFPGLLPVPASHLPDNLKDRDDKFGKGLVANFDRLARTDGILVNSFGALESKAVDALTAGLCVPGRKMPPVYLIGPVAAGGESGDGDRHECLMWLDAHPKGSVVFLCFGSMGAFPSEQLTEIAVGLERSGQRFLWVVRAPPVGEGLKKFSAARTEPDLDALMPEGFLERTEGRGMVVKSWAPQVEVLRHEAVGGFVSHCGWNSTLEAVSAGVPMIAWPLYAEQKLNRVFLVEEAKVAVAIEGYDKEKVRAEEVERKVRWLMEEDGGKELRERALAMKEAATAAREEGGSSHRALMDLMKVLRSSG